MSDNYQAVYDAVRSRFHSGDVQGALESALRDAFSGADLQLRCVGQEFAAAAQEMQRPSVLYRPSVFIDGNQWCALYGENLQDGVAGFGDSPEKAMTAFDAAWQSALKPKEPQS